MVYAPFKGKSYIQEVVQQTAAQWALTGNFILQPYQFGLETDTGRAKYGDGTSTWDELAYWVAGVVGLPQADINADYTLGLSDNGKKIVNSGASVTVTIEDSAVVDWPTDEAITIYNAAATDLTIDITTDTLNYVNVGPVTTITVPQYNMVTLIYNGAGSWVGSGTAGVATT